MIKKNIFIIISVCIFLYVYVLYEIVGICKWIYIYYNIYDRVSGKFLGVSIYFLLGVLGKFNFLSLYKI